MRPPERERKDFRAAPHNASGRAGGRFHPLRLGASVSFAQPVDEPGAPEDMPWYD